MSDDAIVQEGVVRFEIQERAREDAPFQARLAGTEGWCRGSDLRTAITSAVVFATEDDVVDELGELWEGRE